jgi:hypothetical protein
VAVAEGGGRGEVREYGRIANMAAALTSLLRKLCGAGVRLRFCYEAGRMALAFTCLLRVKADVRVVGI